MGRRNRTRDIGAILLAGLAFAAWLGCGADGSGDPTADDGTGTPTSSTATTNPTSSRPEFEASFPDSDGGTPNDGGSTGDGGNPTTCNDPNDVGGSEPTAKDLGTITDNDNDGSSVSGVVASAVDVDFYKFVGTDTFGYVVDPTIASSSAGVQFCMFVSCLKGSGIQFKSCSGGTQATSGLGNPGCCFTAPGSTTMDYNCQSTTDESATVFIEVKESGNQCLPYTASYHF